MPVPRSIPACAGEPPGSAPREACNAVHPRVCGGAFQLHDLECVHSGPSPRVRGSRTNRRYRRPIRGSIPACAGEPWCRFPMPSSAGVHPRVCGGALDSSGSAHSYQGPSPRVRGSHAERQADVEAFRSIPACAGEPLSPACSGPYAGVHPRVCGGAFRIRLPRQFFQGPSPRVRGSLYPYRDDACTPRSIPACAGEPGAGRSASRCARVHPRVCGGASVLGRLRMTSLGPSPRVRGSRVSRCPRPPVRGSIPACAGEPVVSVPKTTWSRVHPRVCGGAAHLRLHLHPRRGPSPRVRGSRQDPRWSPRRVGSIPACAGEP